MHHCFAPNCVEYILYRLSRYYSAIVGPDGRAPPFKIRGFGTTLKHPEGTPSHHFPDFDLEGFHPLAKRMLATFTVSYGADETGDITKLANIRAFAGMIMQKTESMGVDLVVADGGFELPSGQENEAETLSFQLILAQVLAALMTLKRGGNFVLKVFDCYLPPTVGLIHILSRLFDRVHMTKGGLSRPASPERYLVFRGMSHEFDGRVVAHLSKLVEQLAGQGVEGIQDGDNAAPGRFLTDVIPRSLLLSQRSYVDWISSKNLRLAMDQLSACRELWSYVEEPSKPGRRVSPEEVTEMVERLDIPPAEPRM